MVKYTNPDKKDDKNIMHELEMTARYKSLIDEQSDYPTRVAEILPLPLAVPVEKLDKATK